MSFSALAEYSNLACAHLSLQLYNSLAAILGLGVKPQR